MDNVKIFDVQYQTKGILAQRLYPNESLLCFLGGEGCFSSNNNGKKVLEMGCGSGANLWMMAKEGLDVYGLDGSQSGLDAARKHLKKWNVKAELHKGLFDSVPFDDNFFDYVVDVVSMQSLDLKTSEKSLKEIFRVLKNGGKFFSYRLSDRCSAFEDSGGKFIDKCTVDNIYNRDMPLHSNGITSFWNNDIVQEMYNMCGFNVISTEHRSRTYKNEKYIVDYLEIIASK